MLALISSSIYMSHSIIHMFHTISRFSKWISKELMTPALMISVWLCILAYTCSSQFDLSKKSVKFWWTFLSFPFQPFTCYVVWDHKLSVYDILLSTFSLMIFYLVSSTYATYGDDKSLYCFLGHWSTSTPTLFITHPGLTLRHIKVLFCQNHEVFWKLRLQCE